MCEKIKLGLSRNRLFEPDSTVVFCGKYKQEISSVELNKTLKMLCNKEPVITSVIDFADDGAYIHTGNVQQEVVLSSDDCECVMNSYCQKPLKFNEKLFEFTLSSDGFLVIAGHTCVCDSKSLLRLAVYITQFYEKTDLNIEPSVIRTFSQKGTLPIDIVSPLTNKLSSELDDEWRKERRSYTLEDFQKYSDEYLQKTSVPLFIRKKISAQVLSKAKSRCTEEGVDFSSLVYFSFYKALLGNIDVPQKSSKMRISADRRFFHGKDDVFGVGAYNGTVCVSLSKKELRKPELEQLKAFHLDVYRALTSPFRVFSDEMLLASVQPEYCDSSYIYMMKGNKLKSAKNLAQTYGCMNKELCECFYCNLTQVYWRALRSFSDIMLREPFKYNRSAFSVSFVEGAEHSVVELRFDNKKISEDVAQRAFSTAIEQIENF